MNLYHKPTDTQRHLPFTSSHPNNCKWNIPFYLAQRIYTITEINAKYLNNFENLSNLSKYQYLVSLKKQGFQKVLLVSQKDLRKLKKPSNESMLPFVTTFNSKNLNIYSTIKFSVNCLKINSVSGLFNINLIQSKR